MNYFWIALALSFARSSPAQTIFPIAQGTTWEYRLTDSSATRVQPTIITVTIAETQQVDGKDVLKLETRAGNILQKTEFFANDERGLFCLRRQWPNGRRISFEPPQRLLPPALKIGAKWEMDDEVAGSGMHQQFTVAAEEELQIPAGTFHAYRFECEEPWPMSVAIQRWFVPGTGFVKEITTTRGPTGRLVSRLTMVLQRFSTPEAPLPNESPAPLPLPSATPLPATIAVVVAKTRDGEPATEFRSDAPHIFVRWTGQHLPVGGAVRVAWIAEDVGEVAPPNFVVDQTEITVNTPEFGAQFTLSRPKDGWAAGKYRVELYLEDKLMESVKVNIVE